MVPQRPEEIEPAIAAALDRLIAQSRLDAESCGPAHAQGRARLAALVESADDLRRRLNARTIGRSDHVPHQPHQQQQNEPSGADDDE